MNRELTRILREKAEHIFEDMAFLLPGETEECAGDPEPGAELCHYIRLAFQGPSRGFFWMGVSEDLFKAITVNMLGLKDPAGVSQAQCLDALGEITNILCGHVLGAWAGARAVFHLGTPVPENSLQMPGDSSQPGEWVTVPISLDAGNAQLWIWIAAAT